MYDDFRAAGGQRAKLLGYDGPFRNRRLCQFSGENGDFLTAVPTAFQFLLAFAATHKYGSLIRFEGDNSDENTFISDVGRRVNACSPFEGAVRPASRRNQTRGCFSNWVGVFR
jgi:hypothetical protein